MIGSSIGVGIGIGVAIGPGIDWGNKIENDPDSDSDRLQVNIQGALVVASDGAFYPRGGIPVNRRLQFRRRSPGLS